MGAILFFRADTLGCGVGINSSFITNSPKGHIIEAWFMSPIGLSESSPALSGAWYRCFFVI